MFDRKNYIAAVFENMSEKQVKRVANNDYYMYVIFILSVTNAGASIRIKLTNKTPNVERITANGYSFVLDGFDAQNIARNYLAA